MSKLTGIKAVLADPKRLSKWKANPGLRRRLPDNMLTPEQRLARRMGREIFPGAGITGFEQARQAKSATDQVYGPQKLALQEQQNVIGAQRQRNAGWWDQYVGQLQAMQTPQANLSQSPNVAAQYGAAPDLGTQQAAGGYQQALSSLAAGLLANNVAVGGQRKLESLAGLDAQELGVVQKKGALAKEAELFKQDQKGKISEAARTAYLENIGFLGKQAAQELAAKKLAETTRHNKAAENKPSSPKYGPDGIHTVEEFRNATPEQKAAWLKEVGKGPKSPKAKSPKAGEPGSPQRKEKWDTAQAVLRNQKTPWLDGKGRTVYTVNGKTVSLPKGAAPPEGAVLRQRPITPAYAKSHRDQLIDAMVLKKKIPRDIAARAVDRFIAGGSSSGANGSPH